jgi:Protein phosphatase 2C
MMHVNGGSFEGRERTGLSLVTLFVDKSRGLTPWPGQWHSIVTVALILPAIVPNLSQKKANKNKNKSIEACVLLVPINPCSHVVDTAPQSCCTRPHHSAMSLGSTDENEVVASHTGDSASVKLPYVATVSFISSGRSFHVALHSRETPNFWSSDNPTFRFGVLDEKGPRRMMEDAHSYVFDYDGVHGQGFFAVFDGHAGREAADWCGKNFHEVSSELSRSMMSGHVRFRSTF